MNPIGDMFFFIKTLIFTLFFVIFLQVKIGDATLEEHFMDFVYKSEVAAPLHDVADGGVAVIRDGWKKVIRQFKGDVLKDFRTTNIPGSRNIGIELERSKNYLQEKAKEAAEKLQGELEAEQNTQQEKQPPKRRSRFD